MYKTLELISQNYSEDSKCICFSKVINCSYRIKLENDKCIKLYHMNIIPEKLDKLNKELKLNFIDYMDGGDENWDETKYYCNPFLENKYKLKEFVKHNPILNENVELIFDFIGNTISEKIYLEICYDFSEKKREYSITCEHFYSGDKIYTNEILHNNEFFTYLALKLCLKLDDFEQPEYIELRFKKYGILKFDLFDTYSKIKGDHIEYILPIYRNINELLHIIKYNEVCNIQDYITEINDDNKLSEINRIMSEKNRSFDVIKSVIIDGKEITKNDNIIILILGLNTSY